jgi:hypothetical protein
MCRWESCEIAVASRSKRCRRSAEEERLDGRTLTVKVVWVRLPPSALFFFSVVYRHAPANFSIEFEQTADL